MKNMVRSQWLGASFEAAVRVVVIVCAVAAACMLEAGCSHNSVQSTYKQEPYRFEPYRPQAASTAGMRPRPSTATLYPGSTSYSPSSPPPPPIAPYQPGAAHH